MEGRNVRLSAGNLRTFVIWLTVSTLYLPFCLSQDRCFLRNGKAKPYSGGWYEFSCNDGYKLEGPTIGFCSGSRQRCVRSFKDCPLNYCVHMVISPLPANCYCEDSQQPIQWKCVSYKWEPHCRCLPLSKKYYESVRYYPSSPDHKYAENTQAEYSCKYDDSFHANMKTAICNQTGGWSKGRDQDCACKIFSQLGHRGILNIHYKFRGREINGDEDGLVPLTTKAYYSCGYGYKVGSQPTCTPSGWIYYGEMRCVTEIPPTARGTLQGSSAAHHHKEDERTLVIVSTSTGSILGALIILVIIVSCQRRLHYHRLRRARLRCRQDQEAFAAYITYHRNVGMTLPSYDEAVNQLQHGQPPTFDEAVANDGPQVDTSTSSETTNPVSITEGSATVVVRSSEDSDSSSTPITGSRLVRVFRFLFGGSAYTTVQGCYVGYGHLVNREAVESTNENEEVENGPSCPEEEERINEINAMNEVLSRAGLC